MTAFLAGLLASIVKALGQDVVQGVLQALQAWQARADQISLGQQQQKAVDANQATQTANQTAKTVADESQAEADAPKTVAGDLGRMEDGTA